MLKTVLSWRPHVIVYSKVNRVQKFEVIEYCYADVCKWDKISNLSLIVCHVLLSLYSVTFTVFDFFKKII